MNQLLRFVHSSDGYQLKLAILLASTGCFFSLPVCAEVLVKENTNSSQSAPPTIIFGVDPLPGDSLSSKEKTLSNIDSTRASDLLAPDPINQLISQAANPSESTEEKAPEPADINGVSKTTIKQPPLTSGSLIIPVAGKGDSAFKFGFGSILGEPQALKGGTRRVVVKPESQEVAAISFAMHFRQLLSENQSLLLELLANFQEFSADLSYNLKPGPGPGTISVNFQNVQAESPSFEPGNRDVTLPNGDQPWVTRLGGGVAYSTPLSPKLTAAFGLNYQQVIVRDDIFSSNVSPFDEFGNKLTASNSGIDNLFTFNSFLLYSSVDNKYFPNQGTVARLGFDQSFPVGSGNILYTRFAGNLSQFIPFNLFGFSQGPRTLILNAQAGTMIGDVPPYEAFVLGGGNSVRGYSKGELATAPSFIQLTAEYEFPIWTFKLGKKPINLRGALFFDYGNDFGTQSEVIGQPGIVREKDGEGFGYGFGIHFRTPIGLLRLEQAWNNNGGSEFIFEIGSRF